VRFSSSEHGDEKSSSSSHPFRKKPIRSGTKSTPGITASRRAAPSELTF
jgi:hypothetical protein